MKPPQYTGKDLGLDPSNPFYNSPVISSYSAQDAAADGVSMELAPNVFITTNAARTLAPCTEPDMEIELNKLRRIAVLLLTGYMNGEYCQPLRCASAPWEADASLAYYCVNGDALASATEPHADDVRVWIAGEGDHVTIMLPEDY